MTCAGVATGSAGWTGRWMDAAFARARPKRGRLPADPLWGTGGVLRPLVVGMCLPGDGDATGAALVQADLREWLPDRHEGDLSVLVAWDGHAGLWLVRAGCCRLVGKAGRTLGWEPGRGRPAISSPAIGAAESGNRQE